MRSPRRRPPPPTSRSPNWAPRGGGSLNALGTNSTTTASERLEIFEQEAAVCVRDEREGVLALEAAATEAEDDLAALEEQVAVLQESAALAAADALAEQNARAAQRREDMAQLEYEAEARLEEIRSAARFDAEARIGEVVAAAQRELAVQLELLREEAGARLDEHLLFDAQRGDDDAECLAMGERATFLKREVEALRLENADLRAACDAAEQRPLPRAVALEERRDHRDDDSGSDGDDQADVSATAIAEKLRLLDTLWRAAPEDAGLASSRFYADLLADSSAAQWVLSAHVEQLEMLQSLKHLHTEKTRVERLGRRGAANLEIAIAELRRHVADFKERYGERAVIYLAALFPNPS